MNVYSKKLLVSAFALTTLIGGAALNSAIAETCRGNVDKCSLRCEIKHQGNATRADICEQNCNGAYSACLARNQRQPRRPMPSDPPDPKHKQPTYTNPGNRGLQPTDPKHSAPVGKSSGSHSMRSK